MRGDDLDLRHRVRPADVPGQRAGAALTQPCRSPGVSGSRKSGALLLCVSRANTRSGDLRVHVSGEATSTDIGGTVLKLIVFIARLSYSRDI